MRSRDRRPTPALALAALVASLLPGAASASTFTVPAGGAGGAEALAERCDAGAARARELFEALETRSGEPTVATLLDPYNELERRIADGTYQSSLLLNVHPDPAVRAAAGQCRQRYASLDTEVGLSQPIYEAFAAIDVSTEPAETRFFVDRKLREFRLNGVDRDADTRARIRELNDAIVAAGIDFGRNAREDVRSIEISPDRLAGLPADWIEGRPPGDDGRVRVTTDYPDYLPFMRYAEDDAAREALYREFNNRAWPANETPLRTLLEGRYELARLTGFDSWADRATADKMTGSAAAARAFVDRGSAVSLPRAKEDYGELLARLRRIDPGATGVMPWQDSWLSNLIKQEKYAVNAAALRPYFEYGKVRDGIFELVGDLWDLRIERRDAQTWHADVEAYRMFLGERLLGYFYLDMHPRDGKFKHAAMFQISNGVRDRHLPAAALVTNMPGGGGERGYLEQQQVESFLHEFGHLVHWLTMGHQRWAGNTTPEWDFIEAPSLMLQEWIYDPDTLRRFATDDDGKPIPVEMVERMRRARDVGRGLFIHRQMYLAAVSLSLYDEDPADFEILPRFREVTAEYSLYPYVDGTHMYTSFGHLDGYSAYYYTYMWSLVIAQDMFGRFESEGLRNTRVARAYRDEVLAAGGSRPAGESVAAFLGRPYNFEAFERRLERGD